MRLSWTFEEVDAKLHDIMVGIFAKVDDAANAMAQRATMWQAQTLQDSKRLQML